MKTWKPRWQLLNYVHLAATSHEIWVCLPSFRLSNRAPKNPFWLHDGWSSSSFKHAILWAREIPVTSESIKAFTAEIRNPIKVATWPWPQPIFRRLPPSHFPHCPRDWPVKSWPLIRITWRLFVGFWDHLIYGAFWKWGYPKMVGQ